MRNRYETRKTRRGVYEVLDRQTKQVMDSAYSRTLCEETRKHLEAKHRAALAGGAGAARPCVGDERVGAS